MNHDYYIERLSGYHDKNLPLDEMELLSRHLDECDECRVALAEYDKLDRMVEKQSGLGGSEEYWEGLANRIESKIESSNDDKVKDISPGGYGYKGLGWKFAAVAASFAIIGFIALYQEDILDSALDEVKQPAGEQDVLKRLSDKPAAKTKGAGRTSMSDSARIASVEKLSRLKIKDSKKVQPKPGVPESTVRERGSISPMERRSVIGGRTKRIELVEADDINVELQSMSKKETPKKPMPVLEEATPASVAVEKLYRPSSISQSIVMDSIATRSLADWQATRDSIRNDNPTVQELDKFVSQTGKELKVKSSAVESEVYSDSFTDTMVNKPPADSLFLLAYYNVGRLTSYKSELNRSIRFLENYLKQSKPLLKIQAEGYLNELRSRDIR